MTVRWGHRAFFTAALCCAVVAVGGIEALTFTLAANLHNWIVGNLFAFAIIASVFCSWFLIHGARELDREADEAPYIITVDQRGRPLRLDDVPIGSSASSRELSITHAEFWRNRANKLPLSREEQAYFFALLANQFSDPDESQEGKR